MTLVTTNEWSDVPLSPWIDSAIDRRAAEQLLHVAQASELGGRDGARILVDNHRKLRTQGMVGVIASPAITLEILPKIDPSEGDAVARTRLVEMLSVAFDLSIDAERIARMNVQHETLLEVLIRRFCDLVFSALQRGLPRRYVQQADDLRALRGRLDVTRQFTLLAANPSKLACRFDALSADIPLNRIVRAAISRLRTLARAPDNERRLSELLFAYGQVNLTPGKSLRWDDLALDRTNRGWHMVISLAQLLLGGRFQTADAGQHHGFALVFDMGKLFERYVGKLIVRSLHGLDVNVCLQGPRDYLLDVLDEDQRGEKTRSFMTQPDIVVRKHGVPVLIADTKWKRLSAGTEDAQHDIKESDVHQMLAYAHVYDVSRLLLLYPHHPNLNSTDELLVSRHVRGTVDRRLYAATLSLCGGARVTQRLTHLALTFGLSADGAETAQNIASAAS